MKTSFSGLGKFQLAHLKPIEGKMMEPPKAWKPVLDQERVFHVRPIDADLVRKKPNLRVPMKQPADPYIC